jgi:hypothetical protein
MGRDGFRQFELRVCHLPPIYILSAPEPVALQLVQKTTRPSAGLLISTISVWVIRGGRNPLVEDFTSSMAELSGVLPSLLMLTCEKPEIVIANITKNEKRVCFMEWLIFSQWIGPDMKIASRSGSYKTLIETQI